MSLENKVWSVLEDILDPEVHINIVDMGLVYNVDIDDKNNVGIRMTLTVPECPLADEIVGEVQEKVSAIDGVNQVNVQLVWEPAWTPARMNDQAIEEFKRRQTMV